MDNLEEYHVDYDTFPYHATQLRSSSFLSPTMLRQSFRFDDKFSSNHVYSIYV